MNRRQKPYPHTTPDLPIQYHGEEPARWRDLLIPTAAAVLLFLAVVAAATFCAVIYIRYGVLS